MSSEVEVTPFKREERYIVIKRKHLMPHRETQIRQLLHRCNIKIVDAVVIEHDWPEYEIVWQMIEARCTGRQAAEQAAAERERELVEALEKAIVWFQEYADEHERNVNLSRDFGWVNSCRTKAIQNTMRAAELRAALAKTGERHE